MEDVRTMSAAVAALVLFSGCANQAPPSGGPPDRVPPRVLMTVPASQAVDVPTNTPIEVTFSEHMDRRSVERAVFVSPRHAPEPRLRWKGRRLIIQIPSPLRSDRTYRVSIGAESADEARNRMTVSHDFAFSTGSGISRGEIAGSVRLETGDAVFVWAFDLASIDPDPGINEPSYATQAGTDGTFRFPGMGRGAYRVFAFTDIDRDRSYTSGLDGLGVPPATVELSADTSRVTLGTIRTVVRDTTGPSIVSVRTRDRTHVRVRFDEPLNSIGHININGLEVVVTHADPTDSSIVWVLTSPQEEGVDYGLSAEGMSDLFGNVGLKSVVEVKGDGRPDARRPTAVSVWPTSEGQEITHAAPLVVTFDEAMHPDLPSPLWIESSPDSVESSANILWASDSAGWVAPHELSLKPQVNWPPGTYSMEMAPGLADPAGNLLEAPIRFTFTAVSAEDNGSLSGRIQSEDYPIVVVATGLDGLGEGRFRVTPGDTTFVIGPLRPGRYVVKAFGDVNDDALWDPGRVTPFRAAEPVASFVDTVDVPPRWESTIERSFRVPILQTMGDRLDG
jgi:uncharacterized protein (DUF2141 family)